ncbi:response regulator [Sulfurisoma sediminicola]|uniref:Response regulator receiver domain-containing protein n=1 Tax=Sulfurisoma sediminicola TaxID=1381557 RepID=A0A497X9E5_9PROT|nr:response regulator [Sulfurisoma sediminicola]RLJ62861.1 response regulator receiver domain-containing protein [Sulfurisoma sediminicola]
MKRVLIVDDEAQMRGLLEDVLGEDYEVMIACDGAEALQKLAQDGAELIITDVVMPKMNGLDLMVAVRKQYPALKVIAISGGGNIGRLDYLPIASLLGAARVIHKPFAVAEMHTAVRELLAA